MPEDVIPASRKLGRDDATDLARSAARVIVAKGKKVSEFTVRGEPGEEVVAAMLGPTGNLRAPALKVGRTVLVGFDEESYRSVLLG
ncbi:MAG: hypothetical protein H6983_13215 [Ectothiorhodospiraceae bacterium]|nr:hypothetical protein [Ectothiorhodospiraceae bacterium]